LAYRYPNIKHTVKILSSLQQAPLKVNDDSLPSLVVLPENDEWWSELVVLLDYTHTCEVFHAASDHAHRHHPVNPQVNWETTEKSSRPSDKNRTGTLAQVNNYCFPVEPSAIPPSRWIHGTWSRFIIVSLAALSLQWGTTGAAVLGAWFTPTTSNKFISMCHCILIYSESLGLGCQSGGHLLYAVLSTISWMMLVTSSFLSYYSTKTETRTDILVTIMAPAGDTSDIVAQVSIALCCLSKIIASLNAILILIVCMFQFNAFFD
jgi:hypothetical protein